MNLMLPKSLGIANDSACNGHSLLLPTGNASRALARVGLIPCNQVTRNYLMAVFTVIFVDVKKISDAFGPLTTLQ